MIATKKHENSTYTYTVRIRKEVATGIENIVLGGRDAKSIVS